MAACWSTDPDGTVRLPFDVRTGELDDEVWARWLAWDPVRMVADHAEALAGMRAIYVDAGTRDEFYLDLGAQAFVDALDAVDVEPTYFEFFDAGHMGIDYRYPVADPPPRRTPQRVAVSGSPERRWPSRRARGRGPPWRSRGSGRVGRRAVSVHPVADAD